MDLCDRSWCSGFAKKDKTIYRYLLMLNIKTGLTEAEHTLVRKEAWITWRGIPDRGRACIT